MHFKVIHFESLVSTNDYVHQMGEKGAEEGLVVVSDYQTKGRGRYQRQWKSPKKKGLLFSILLRPAWPTSRAPILTQLIAKAVKHALKSVAGLDSTLKRPNDVLISGKKVCGILTESFSRGLKLDHVVVGVGVNVTSRERELVKGATSIREHTPQKIDLRQLLENILQSFNDLYEEIKNTQVQHSRS